MAHLTGDYTRMEQLISDAENPMNVYALARSCRTYKQMQEMTKIKFLPSPGCNIQADGKYLLHTDHDGNPHCVAIHVRDNNTQVSVWAGDYEVKCSFDDFTLFSADSIEARTRHTFQLVKVVDSST